ncbi:MAG: HEAT repeat domain-containing protein [bacterium]
MRSGENCFSPEKPLSREDIKGFIKQGKECFNEVIPLLNLINWEKYGEKMDEWPLARDLRFVIREIIRNDSGASPDLARFLKSSAWRIRWGIISVLLDEEVKDPALVPFLILLLEDENKSIRRGAVRLLAVQPSEDTGAILAEVLVNEKDQFVLIDVAKGLLERGDARGEKVMRKILFDSPHWAARASAARCLGIVKNNEAFNLLTDALPKEGFQPVVSQIIESIRRHTGLTDDDVRRRWLNVR